MKILLLAAIAAVPAVAFAAGADTEVVSLDPVTVTATRTPVLESDVLAPSIVIDRDEIERSQATDVAGVLQQYAGLEVARNGGPGQPASLFIRGGNSNHVVVLIDGVRTDDATAGAPPLADISPEMIERIEVIEGPRTTLYGPDAIGGVINIITRQPGSAQLDASLGGGSYNTVSGAAALRDQGAVDGHAWGAVFDAQQQHSGGFPPLAGNGDSSGYRNRTLNGRGTLVLGRVALEVRAWDTQGNTQYLYDPMTPLAADFHDQILALQARTQLTGNWASTLSFTRSLYRLGQDQPDPFSTQPGFVRTIRPELDWHNVIDADAHNRVSFGARASRERVDALSYDSAYGEVRDTDYGYLQDELGYGRHHGVVAVNYLHDGAFGERFDWSVEYGYDLFARTRLIASAGTAFRAPTTADRFFPGAGNPDLKPEKARNYELAVRQQITSHQRAELRLFRTDVRDLIEFVGSAPQNLDSARSDGVQLSWRYHDAKWDARVNGIWQDPRDRSADMRLLRRARLSGSAQIDRHLGRFDLGAAVYSSSKTPDAYFDPVTYASSPVTNGGYTTLAINAGAQLTPELRLDLRLDNAFNHHYQTVYGYNQSGSAVYATLRYTMPL